MFESMGKKYIIIEAYFFTLSLSKLEGLTNTLFYVSSIPSANANRLKETFLQNFDLPKDTKIKMKYFDSEYDAILVETDYDLYAAFTEADGDELLLYAVLA